MDPVNNRGRASSDGREFSAWEDGSEASSAPRSAEACSAVPESRAEAGEEALASPNPAVRSLVDSYPSSLGGSAPPTASLSADTNSARTMQRDSAEPYVATGTTQGGDWFAAVAALKMRDPRSGADAEIFSASVQVGKQNEAQIAMARVGYSAESGGVSFSMGAEALTARANAGICNDDGSEGANLGAMATGAGIEATVGYSGWSVTAGASISAGVAVSSGQRNVDGDSVPERCFKASIGPATLGFCSEL